MHMKRPLDVVINELQDAIEAYKRAEAQYINEKKQKLNPKELEQSLEQFRINTPFFTTILHRACELIDVLENHDPARYASLQEGLDYG